jgi:hypothetical protein
MSRDNETSGKGALLLYMDIQFENTFQKNNECLNTYYKHSYKQMYNWSSLRYCKWGDLQLGTFKCQYFMFTNDHTWCATVSTASAHSSQRYGLYQLQKLYLASAHISLGTACLNY